MLEATLLVVSILLALAYAYSNGMNDAANAVATVISTRAMTPLAAVIMGGVLNAVGALAGTAVAKTIGKGIIDPELMTQYAVISAIGASVIWVFVATRLGTAPSNTVKPLASSVSSSVATIFVGSLRSII